MDSGPRGNAAKSQAVVFREDLRVDDAAWIRVFFDHVRLEKGSVVRVTSLHDGQTQELDAAGLAMWSYASAFFNGNGVQVEIVAAPGTTANRIGISQVMVEQGVAMAFGDPCGICFGDDRTPSSEDFAGRLMPNGCSATVFNEESCMLTAGHCMGGNNAVAFRIPASNPDCSMNWPAIEEQFPIIQDTFVDAGVGNDWAVLVMGTNNLNQKPFDRYGAMIPIAQSMVSSGDTVTVWGYGTDDSPSCTNNYVQQTSNGVVNSIGSLSFTHDCDTTFGNSGSGIHHDGELVGIVTHCGCPNNVVTRIDHPDVVAARDSLCPEDVVLNDDCASAALGINGQTPFDTEGATTDGPSESGCAGPMEDDIWYNVFATCDGTLNINFSASFNASMAVYPGIGCVGSPNQALACIAPGTPDGLSFSVSAGDSYKVRIGGPAGQFGTGLLDVECEESAQCDEDCAEPSDGVVNIVDLLAMLGQWGSGGSCAITSENNSVDVNDLLQLLSAFGATCQ
jgi:hypothetical protein